MRKPSLLLFAAALVGSVNSPSVRAEGPPSKKPAASAKAKAGEETIDQIVEKAERASEAPSEPAPAHVEPAPVAAKKSPEAPPPVKAPAKPVEAAPITDDNDTTQEAAKPVALEAVKPTAKRRVPGPYELGALDCRMLDGAGIERILPKKLVAGEEPDVLCRIVVTQPATVAPVAHEVTFTVYVGAKTTYQQVRPVRISAIGRRALVFVLPADRIASDEVAKVTLRAVLSNPAKPNVREVKLTVEPAD